MARILLVDDDEHIREVARFALEQASHDVFEASDGAIALDVFESVAPDVVVLDVTMPELDGLEVCRRIRADHATPIIFLSSRAEEIDRILGLEMGADDYLTKPFSPRELVSRVKATLRRVELERNRSNDSPGRMIARGAITIDLDALSVSFNDIDISLTSTEFNLLRTVMQRPTKVFNREELMRGAYDALTHVSDRTIDSHVRHIREKFAVTGHDPLETVHGVGYRFRQ